MAFRLIPAAIKIAFRNAVKKRYRFKEYEESYNDCRKQHFEKRHLIEAGIPKTALLAQHIANVTVLVNRHELLKRMPSNAVCAEIGVAEGKFSEEILNVTKPKTLHLVDAWGDMSRYHDGMQLAIHKKFSAEIEDGVIAVHVGYSTDVLKTFPDKYFDWVYLDTNHTYITTAEELSILQHKVKPAGIIAGHDYIIGNWIGDFRYGVIEAVHEFCVREQWELIFLTINKEEMPSFAIKKIAGIRATAGTIGND